MAAAAVVRSQPRPAAVGVDEVDDGDAGGGDDDAVAEHVPHVSGGAAGGGGAVERAGGADDGEGDWAGEEEDGGVEEMLGEGGSDEGPAQNCACLPGRSQDTAIGWRRLPDFAVCSSKVPNLLGLRPRYCYYERWFRRRNEPAIRIAGLQTVERPVLVQCLVAKQRCA